MVSPILLSYFLSQIVTLSLGYPVGVYFKQWLCEGPMNNWQHHVRPSYGEYRQAENLRQGPLGGKRIWGENKGIGIPGQTRHATF